ncbi:MAG: methyltransferase [Bacteroidota bacterium]
MDTATLASKVVVSPATPVSPEHILKLGMGYWASKTVLTAVQLKLFTILAQKPHSAGEIRERLGLHERSYLDFLDALVALKLLKRKGLGGEAIYSNTPETDTFLDRNKPSYLGGILEMSNNRLYKYWNDLEEGLKTGLPQNELKDSHSESQFNDFYSNPESLAEFMRAMAGIQMGAFISLAQQFDFSPYRRFVDIGGGNGSLSIQVALHNPQIECTTFDLPVVEPVAKDTIDRFSLSTRIRTAGGDFFNDDLPQGDVVAMGNVLHDWNEKEKLLLMKKAFDLLPAGGAFVCIESIIDNNRSENAFGLLMSLNMLIETKGGFDYTFNDFDRWAHQSGFHRTEWLPLAGPTSAAIAYKA